MWGQLKCIVQYYTDHLSFPVEINNRCCQLTRFILTNYGVKLWIYRLMALTDPVDSEGDNSGEMLQELSNDDAGSFTEVFTTMMQVFASFSVVCPTLLVVAVIIRQPRLNNFRYWFIANLLVCNILVALLFLPAAINTAVNMFSDQVNSKQFVVGFASIPSVAYCLMCCVVFVDMFCFLFFDKYQDFLTSKKAIAMVSIAWGVSCAVVVLLSILKTSISLSDHWILLIICVTLLVVKISIGVSVLCTNVYLFYYWTKVNVKLQAEVLNIPTSDNKCRLHKQIDVFVRVEMCIKLFFAFFSISLFSVAIEIIKVIIITGFHHSPFSFVIFIILTWMECMFCVLAYFILLLTIVDYSYIRNKIMPST